MNIQRKSMLLVFLILLTPSILFAGYEIKTGYDLYQNIKLIDNPQTEDDLLCGMYATAYVSGFIDSLALIQDLLLRGMLPRKRFSEEEINKIAKELNYHRLNVPEKGLPVGQFILIYKKYAEKHPEKLGGTVRTCIFESLVEAYGWK